MSHGASSPCCLSKFMSHAWFKPSCHNVSQVHLCITCYLRVYWVKILPNSNPNPHVQMMPSQQCVRSRSFWLHQENWRLLQIGLPGQLGHVGTLNTWWTCGWSPTAGIAQLKELTYSWLVCQHALERPGCQETWCLLTLVKENDA